MTTQQSIQFGQAASLLLYGYAEEPVCCPHCGQRTYFQELSGSLLGVPEEVGLQLHRCLGERCHYIFLASEAS